MDAELTWRNIYDCKVIGENISITIKKAFEGHYPFICHNDNIYRVKQKQDEFHTLDSEFVGDLEELKIASKGW